MAGFIACYALRMFLKQIKLSQIKNILKNSYTAQLFESQASMGF